MKERELRAHATCDLCRSLIGNSGVPLFWTVRLQQHGVKLNTVRRQDGLTALLGGQAELARVMGPDEEMTETLTDVSLNVCATCALKEGEALIPRMAEIADERDRVAAAANG